MTNVEHAGHEMTRVLDSAPRLAALGRGGSVSAEWRHGALHDTTRPMSEHVFMTYVGSTRKIARASEGRERRGWTRKGTVTLIPAGATARWDIEGSIDVVHFYIAPDRLRSFASDNELTSCGDLPELLVEADHEGSALLSLVSRACHGVRAEDALYKRHASDLFCAHLLGLSSQTFDQARALRGGLAPWQVRRITDHLEDHLADDVTLADLGELLGLSTFHVCRAFKQSTGVPPHRWRHQRRMERGRELLEGTNLPITEIAASVGYDDPSRFASAFRKAFGLSPTDYRRERRF